MLDGSTGSTGRFSGKFEIPERVGRRAGGNLFHSFERFNVQRGESATFTGGGGIDNVISRVTGDQASTIDGLLASTVPGADFFFLNPNGVIFGPEARLSIDGSFHVSTAHELRFEDATAFSTGDSSESSFTAAAPEALGFLGAEVGTIKVDQGRLRVPERETLSLVGGPVRIFGNGQLLATLPISPLKVLGSVVRLDKVVKLSGVASDTFFTVEAGLKIDANGDPLNPALVDLVQQVEPAIEPLGFTNPIFVDRDGLGYL
ncbi:MAG: filamentous hemagglutinin N-terminal domain-containing protein, partial [Geminicoccaceae bacterium]|nr:filamentous hemagglutinin N-terminal domain-containing protein [Geminicoccaceae bacterium]